MIKCVGVFVLGLFFISTTVFAAETDDPNAALRKMRQVTTGVDPILADLQKIQKLNNDQAILFFTGKINKNPKDAVAYAKRGKAYSANKDYKQALIDYNKALEFDPKLADIYVGLAVIYLMQKEYDKCWQEVRKAEALGAKFWPAFTEALEKGSGSKGEQKHI